ncbi:YwgA family protein [Oceanobacillus luteolus]|uniref:YwgA family protein n=1 Tax=Oceanobacillus luteolus TaxID=1274358 RepID=A0ABW4HLY7_9BACI|nr:YwgA family protein [Oceanobacillus luteolus]MCM3741444.1 YwgA family protein [Oceanobacillus luteolus]
MLIKHAKLIHFFCVANEVTGRKKLQKMIYILQKADCPFEEKYQFHFYGPYSEELTLRVEELCNLGFLTETKEDKANYFQYCYHVTPEGENFLKQFTLDMPDMMEKVDLLKSKSSRFLELVSTILYFEDLPQLEQVEKLHQVKPKQNFSDEEIKEAYKFITQIREL